MALHGERLIIAVRSGGSGRLRAAEAGATRIGGMTAGSTPAPMPMPSSTRVISARGTIPAPMM